MKYHNTFIITSVIYFKDKPLSYSKIRSIYTPEERSNQTILTINSIRQNLPGAKIILLEGGASRDISKEIISKIDEYVYMGNNSIVKLLVNSKFKSSGEAIMLIMMSSKIIKDSKFIFKISGRYLLNQNFNINLWNTYFTCKTYSNTISTRLYGFPRTQKARWRWILIKSLPFLLVGISLEKIMFFFLKKYNLNKIETLGIEGSVAPDGQGINE